MWRVFPVLKHETRDETKKNETNQEKRDKLRDETVTRKQTVTRIWSRRRDERGQLFLPVQSGVSPVECCESVRLLILTVRPLFLSEALMWSLRVRSGRILLFNDVLIGLPLLHTAAQTAGSVGETCNIYTLTLMHSKHSAQTDAKSSGESSLTSFKSLTSFTNRYTCTHAHADIMSLLYRNNTCWIQHK